MRQVFVSTNYSNMSLRERGLLHARHRLPLDPKRNRCQKEHYGDFINGMVMEECHVKFVNMAPFAFVTEFSVGYGYDHTIHVLIEVLPSKCYTLHKALLAWQGALAESSTVKIAESLWTMGHRIPTCSISLQDSSQLMLLIQMLKNYKDEVLLFSDDLIKELNQITEYLERRYHINGTERLYRHKIPILPSIPLEANQERDTSMHLSELLRAKSDDAPLYLSEEKIAEVEFWLTQGEDPAQFDPKKGAQPLDFAGDLQVCEKLVLFGANPFTRRRGYRHYSSYEWALRHNQKEKLAFFAELLCQVEKPLPIRIQNLKSFFQDGRVITNLDCYPVDAKSKLGPTYLRTEIMTQLPEKAIDVFSLCAPAFQSKESESLLNQMKKAFSKEGQIIEIFWDRSTESVVGFIILEWLNVKDLKVLFGNLMTFAPSIRGLGIAGFFLWRPGYVTETDAGAGLFIAPESYRLMDEWNSPKFQTPVMEDYTRAFISVLGIPPEHYHHKPGSMTCYVKDPLMIRRKEKPDWRERVFFRDMMGLRDASVQDGRAVPGVFLLTVKSFLSYKFLSKKLGVDIHAHAEELGEAFEAFSSYHNSNTKLKLPSVRRKPLSYARRWFWDQEKVPSFVKVIPDPVKFRAKL